MLRCGRSVVLSLADGPLTGLLPVPLLRPGPGPAPTPDGGPTGSRSGKNCRDCRVRTSFVTRLTLFKTQKFDALDELLMFV